MKKAQSRFLVTYTPVYAVRPNVVLFDSSKKNKNFKDAHAAIEFAEKRMLIDEDAHLEFLMVYPKLTNKEVLKYLDLAMPLSTPKSSYYHDLGILARRAVDEVRDSLNKFNEKIKESERILKYIPKGK